MTVIIDYNVLFNCCKHISSHRGGLIYRTPEICERIEEGLSNIIFELRLEYHISRGMSFKPLCESDHDTIVDLFAICGSRYSKFAVTMEFLTRLLHNTETPLRRCKSGEYDRALLEALDFVASCRATEAILCLNDEQYHEAVKQYENLRATPLQSHCGPARVYHVAKSSK